MNSGITVEQAWRDALYGPGGFYRREHPADHFRTASHVAPDELAGAMLRLATQGHCRTVVDVGAGSGELLAALARHPDAGGLDLVAVDLRPRPDGLPSRVQWLERPPDLTTASLLIGWELLDVVPCPVLQAGDDGTLAVLVVGPDGHPEPGGDPDPEDLAWCERWWPGPYRPGDVVEVGRARDEFWAELVAGQVEGLALAVDYDHIAGQRPPHGTLLGFRDGLAQAPELDGGMDVTAHVALDSVADRLDLPHLLTRQAQTLSGLAVRPHNPPHELSRTEPLMYLRELDRAGRCRELLDPAGLGGFGWLLSARGQDALAVLHWLDLRSGQAASGPSS